MKAYFLYSLILFNNLDSSSCELKGLKGSSEASEAIMAIERLHESIEAAETITVPKALKGSVDVPEAIMVPEGYMKTAKSAIKATKSDDISSKVSKEVFKESSVAKASKVAKAGILAKASKELKAKASKLKESEFEMP